MEDVTVIGAGASGLTAAINSARHGAKVLLIEKMDRVGKKLLATGNGRCNISNSKLSSSRYHGTCTHLLKSVMADYGGDATRRFFAEIGIEYRQDEDRLYPYSLQASSVLDILRYEVARQGIQCITGCMVQDIIPGDSFSIQTSEGLFQSHRVILAAGGKASSKLGSAGEGFEIARKLGIQVSRLFPALVKLRCESPYLKRLAGVKVEQGVANVWVEQKMLRQEEGEILFTPDGLSGPPILQLSRCAAQGLAEKKEVLIILDLFPSMEEEQLFQMLRGRTRRLGYKTVEESFNGLLHKKLTPVLLACAGLDGTRGSGTLSNHELWRLVKQMKAMKFPVTATGPWQEAQVTAGGIIAKEVTGALEAKRYPGLFFSGEVLDIDGDCGGFNLQWAWSSGLLAGRNAAVSIAK